MSTTKAVELGKSIDDQAQQLERDLRQKEAKRSAFGDIRELRRSLNELEEDLRDEAERPAHDAC